MPPPASSNKRLARELRTLEAMVRCYCRAHHQRQASYCAECAALLEYAAVRLERCHFGADKPTCVKCPVHCYSPARREEVKVVMRYAGPRMLFLHPWLALRHWLDGFRRQRL